MPRVRLDSQNPAHGTCSLLNGNGTQPQTIQFIASKLPGKTKPLAVIVYYKYETAVILRQFYHDMGSLGMLFYIVECFTVNLEDFAANAVGSAQLGGIDQQIKGDGAFVAVTLGKAAHEVNQIGTLHAQRPEVSDGLAELGTLVSDGLLQAGEANDGLLRRGRSSSPQNVQLDFDAQECLKYPVVQVARNAAAFGLDGAGAQVPQEEDVLKAGGHVRGDAFQPG